MFGTTHLHTEYFEDGTMSRQGIRLDETHELVAGSRTWFENGQMKCRADQMVDAFCARANDLLGAR